MELLSHHSLRPYNTFGMDCRAEFFARVADLSALLEALQWARQKQQPIHILGGGSNVLLTADVPGLVLHNAIKGIEVVDATAEDAVIIAAGAGVTWHDLVMWSLQQDLGGLENLSLIPGTAGAAPIQNIGAYGVELKDVFEKLEAVSIEDGQLHTFSNADCRFGYRDSIFKNEYKNRYCITKIYLKLSKGAHQLHTGYGAIQETLEAMGIRQATIQDVSKAVIYIRSSKLPNPAEIGNAGSFFKNPEIEIDRLEALKEQYPHIISFAGTTPGYAKVPAGWLIDQCGWRGYRQGDAGCYDKQALVLVNYGHATGAEITSLARNIVASVKEKFGIVLSPEVNIW